MSALYVLGEGEHSILTAVTERSSSQGVPRVAIINDHELIVRGVKAMLKPFDHLVHVVELESGSPVRERVDIALYDTYTKTDLSGKDLDDLVENPQVGQVVLFTWTLTDEMVNAARDRGISAALPKSMDAPALAEALFQMHRCAPPLGVIEVKNPAPTKDWPGRAEGLTPRQAEIISLITCGLSNKDIAARTYLTANSVKAYIRAAYRTMGVNSRTQAVLWGLEHGMAPKDADVSAVRRDIP